MTPTTRWLITGAVTLCALALPAADAADSAAQAGAIAQFQRAAGGDTSAIEATAAELRRLSAAEPADPRLRAYAGAATSMLAKTTILPWRKLGFVEDGLALIDKALAQLTPAHDAPLHDGVPAGLETRFIAASNFLALPSLFNRNVRGAKLLGEVLNHPRLDAAPLHFRAAVWLRAGLEAARAGRTGEARQWLHKAAASGTPQAAAAQAQLKEL